MPPSSHQVGSDLVLAHLAGPSQKQSGEVTVHEVLALNEKQGEYHLSFP